jgi:long-chain fatty acid transport protein
MKRIVSVFYPVFFAALSLFFAANVYATNGMNLEGYGPIATGMGGASMAYDNGTAAMMNNPATLGLMPEGDRLDVALGSLGPHVTSKTPGAPDAASSSTAFYMPAFGLVKKSGQVAYGIGVFSQGGMGTEYGADSFLAAGSGEKVRSELGVGRVLFPIAYNVSDNFTIGGSFDFVWASMDLKMALNGAQFADLVGPSFGGRQTTGTASGAMVNTLGGAFAPNSCGPGVACLSQLNWVRFDFSDNDAFTGKAKATGFGAKIGGVYKVNSTLAVGAAYHSKTSLDDMEAPGTTLSMNVAGAATPGGLPATIPVTGKLKIVDFQWPQMIGAGVAYNATDKLLLVFDYKWINWGDVMDNFRMTFTADVSQSNTSAQAFGLGGKSMNATLFQKWKDQNVFMLGAGYKVTDDFTVRVGANISDNPIPNTYLLPLFPAIIENHYMVGAGYMFSKASSIDVSYTYAPEVKATTQVLTPSGPVPVTVSHYQNNAQVMYSYRF